ncbi:MAG: CHRD domain-containing protein [Rubricoccaceae bacterium]
MNRRYSLAALCAVLLLALAPLQARAQSLFGPLSPELRAKVVERLGERAAQRLEKAGGFQTEYYIAGLKGANEVPPNSSTATGLGQAIYEADGQGGYFLFYTEFRGLESDINYAIGAHIHEGAVGTNGPVIYPLEIFSDDDRSGFALAIVEEPPAERVDALRAGNFYFNIHTVDRPAGEIRGNLTRVQSLAEARAAGVGQVVEVVGVVSRAKGAFAYIQDGTGGLTVRQTSSPWRTAVDDGEIREGTAVRLRGRLSEFRFLLQINQPNAATNDLESFEILYQFDEVIQPQVVSLFDIAQNGETFEGQLVAIRNVSTTATGQFPAATTIAITDPSDNTNAVSLRIPNAADTDVDGTAIPDSPFTLVGVVSQFSTTTPDVGYQIIPILARDINPTARLQVIHNSPDPAAAAVDVYINGDLTIPNLAFREATPFVELPAIAQLNIAIAPAGSEGPGAAVYTLDGFDLPILFVGQAIATGVLNPDMFAPNPDGIPTNFALLPREAVTAASSGSTVALAVVHGAPDAPTVDVAANGSVLIAELTYTDATGYLEVPPASYTLGVRVTGSPTDVATFTADLTGAGGAAITVLASGFLDPASNQNGPAFGLLAVFADGTTALLPAAVSAESGAEAGRLALAVGQNPVRTASTVHFALPEAGPAELAVYDVLGRRVATLAEGTFMADTHTARFDASALSAGVYVVRLVAGDRAVSRTVTVVR